MALIAGQINTANYPQPDYSGVVRSAQMQAQGLANLGQQIGETIKKRNENEKEIAGGIKMATAMKKAVPALGEMADEVIANLSNPDLSTNKKLLALSGVKEAMQMSLLGNQENRANAALKIQQDQLALEADKIRASADAPKKVTKSTIGLGDGGEMDVLIDEQGNMTDVFGNPISGQRTQAPKGAGANIQNALPQGQGGTFPDGVPTAGLPIGEAAGFTPGVSVDGTPGVLPPKDGTPTTLVYGVRSPKSTEKFRPATKEELALYGAPAGQVDEKSGKFYPLNPPSGMKLESDGKGGFTLVQGSGVGEKAQGVAEAKNNFSTVIEEATNAYSNLYNKGGAVVGGQFSLAQVLASTAAGQKFGEITGSEAQQFRSYLDSLAPKILLGIMASTGLSATQLNSNAELQLQLKSLGDASKPIQSNIAALDTLDKMYGDGTSVSKMLSKNPKLGSLMKESGFDYGKKEAGSTPLDTNPEVEQMLKELGL